MGLFDMPLDKLRQYEGINPKPKDFDEYWSRSLNEMNSIDPNIELIPADFDSPVAKCYDLYFTGVKGARIYAKLFKTS